LQSVSNLILKKGININDIFPFFLLVRFCFVSKEKQYVFARFVETIGSGKLLFLENAMLIHFNSQSKYDKPYDFKVFLKATLN